MFVRFKYNVPFVHYKLLSQAEREREKVDKKYIFTN